MMLCKDCQHHQPHSTMGANLDSCGAPGIERDLVSGKPRWNYCRIQRDADFTDKACGPGGRFFEPKMRDACAADLGLEAA